ncbi:DUF499 domain-containing protein [uncultured Thiodictyon sp.]|jgi:hypothetical protein|uniref:ATP-binding protein n=1 Tax=uncultured Thiodictyon sp. TaxID=1846217 RepID=UPI0025E3D2C4|nr:DUF499 domain-containing protein [uncultured Thiodictyon sp.]
MTLPTIFDLCEPRQDVLQGTISESDFAADLAQVLRGDAPKEYLDPVRFFANTHPTRGLKDLLRNVCLRLTGNPHQVASIFRLDTNYGGGKTHALIALTHAINGMAGVPNADEFLDPALLPTGKVRIAAFDGENADPLSGRSLEPGLLAYTPWGEIAYALAGRDGYERVRRSDEQGGAPGAATIRELFGGEPTLILMDELSVYLRKLKVPEREAAGGQLTAFLSALFKAVESSPNAVVVYTLAIGKGGKATDAYSDENQFIADKMEEAESVSARKATLLNPTEEDETVKILRRRLFTRIDDAGAAPVIESYRHLWEQHRDQLPPAGVGDSRFDTFAAGYPLHPELIDTLREKLSTLSNFQRVRGMLRLLARSVGRLWEQRPADAFAIHLHHLDPGFEPIRQEIVTRLGQRQLVPAIKADVAAVPGDQSALAQQLDAEHYQGLAPYGSYLGRAILFHTLAFNENLKGATPEELRYSILSPGTDLSFIDDARRRFVQGSAYLDDRPNLPLRFSAEANLTQILRREEHRVDPGEARAQLNDRIKSIFGGAVFNLHPFPGGPYDVSDDAGDGKPALVLLGYDAVEVAGDNLAIPELVGRIYEYKDVAGGLRKNRNNLVFLLADQARKEEMKHKMVRRLALNELRRPERLNEFPAHQQDKINGWYHGSESDLAVAIQQCYRHVLYASKHRIEGANLDLAHTAIDMQGASNKPGQGQKQVIEILRANNKLRLPEDDPDSPTYIRDRTPLKKKGTITTAALRAEFRKDPALPILVGDDCFVKGIRRGIELGEYVYQSGDLTCGMGDPWASIHIDEQSFVHTSAYAKEKGIWPKVAEPTPVPGFGTGTATGGATAGTSDETTGGTGMGTGKPDSTGGTGPTGGTGKTVDPPPQSNTLTEEGVLKEALTKLWERARARKFTHIRAIELRLFDATDAFRLLGLVAAVQGATKQVALSGSYVTTDGGTLELEFNGPPTDAQPVKDFLDPQLRAAKEKVVEARFDIRFDDAGLALAGDAAEKLGERLTRFGTGAAYVSITAEGSA